MNEIILQKQVQDFVQHNLKSDVHKLALKGSPFKDINIQELIGQIEAKRKCEKKLPSWFHASNIYYPSKINIEQTSSEFTARHKSHLIKGESIIDLTGGFGVDDIRKAIKLIGPSCGPGFTCKSRPLLSSIRLAG